MDLTNLSDVTLTQGLGVLGALAVGYVGKAVVSGALFKRR